MGFHRPARGFSRAAADFSFLLETWCAPRPSDGWRASLARPVDVFPARAHGLIPAAVCGRGASCGDDGGRAFRVGYVIAARWARIGIRQVRTVPAGDRAMAGRAGGADGRALWTRNEEAR